jgi:hypothetical protein
MEHKCESCHYRPLGYLTTRGRCVQLYGNRSIPSCEKQKLGDVLLKIAKLRRKLVKERATHPGDISQLARSYTIRIVWAVRKFKRMMRERGCIYVSSMKI